MEGDVGVLGVLASLVLVAVAVVLSRALGLRLEASIVGATVRAAAQLVAVGAALALVLDRDAPLVWSWLWVIGMIVLASVIVVRRAPDIPGLFRVALAAEALTVTIALGVVYGLDVFPLEGRTLVPIAGMTVGNSMNAAVVAATRLVEEFSDKRMEVEARLALGYTGAEAARPYLRSILRTSITPQIESTRAVGLIFLPGAMTGLILAGVDPLDAVLVQMVVMYLILGSVTVVATVVALRGVGRLFTPDERLVPVVRSTRDE